MREKYKPPIKEWELSDFKLLKFYNKFGTRSSKFWGEIIWNLEFYSQLNYAGVCLLPPTFSKEPRKPGFGYEFAPSVWPSSTAPHCLEYRKCPVQTHRVLTKRQHTVAVQVWTLETDSQSSDPGSELWAVQCWASSLTPLGLGFFTCKMWTEDPFHRGSCEF